MLDLADWLNSFEEENDPDDFQMPYRIFGPTDEAIMRDRYMRLENVEKPNIVYPAIVSLLS